jgi:hypothetical protein
MRNMALPGKNTGHFLVLAYQNGVNSRPQVRRISPEQPPRMRDRTRVIFDRQLSHGAVRLYMALDDTARQDGVCELQQADIGGSIGVADRYLRELLEELEDGGYLTTKRLQRGCRYTLGWAVPQIGTIAPITGLQIGTIAPITGLQIGTKAPITDVHAAGDPEVLIGAIAPSDRRPGADPTLLNKKTSITTNTSVTDTSSLVDKQTVKEHLVNLPVDRLFDDFWKLYPLKKAKKAARKMFERQVKTETDWERVRAALIAQSPAMLAEEEKYRPHAATWLNGERFNDEPSPPPTPNGKPKNVDERNQKRRDDANFIAKVIRGEIS